MEHRKILGLLFALYSGAHAAWVAFPVLIILIYSGGGFYPKLWLTESVALMVGVPAAVALAAMVTAYGLLKGRRWATASAFFAAILSVLVAAGFALCLAFPRTNGLRLFAGLGYATCAVGLLVYAMFLRARKELTP